MSLTYAQYKATKPHAVVRTAKANLGNVIAGRLWSRWRQAPFTAGGPSSPIALNSGSSGALNRQTPVMPTWIKSVRYGHTTAPILIVDRLTQMGGLSGIVTGTVTTNLPTAALTRHTSGAGVMALIEQDSQVGATASTLSVSYTNSSGVTGRTSPAVSFGGTNDRGAMMSTPLPLQVGDVGIRSVESVTLASTTSTAGDYGIALVKPLAIVQSWDECNAWLFDNVKDMGAWFEDVQADACITYYSLSIGAGGETYPSDGSIDLIRQV